LRRIVITTGDPDGIGFEITAKALTQLPRPRGFQYIVFGSARGNERWLQRILKLGSLIDWQPREDAPSAWVRTAAEGCLAGHFSAMVTGPMSKDPVGHTEILAEVTGVKNPLMAFLGRFFNVVLATGHVPVTDLARHLTPASLEWAIRQAVDLRARLHLTKPVGVLAINPHAGEGGRIGREDLSLATLIQRFDSNSRVVGPLVPDAAFANGQAQRYSVLVAQYHDQGLIPFKALHSYAEGTQVTLGIPFVRTSVDHGTAKDIFNKNKADPGSMVAAIQWARRLL
jgi:4-hydroxythreonine-4-phosphate dehydrogenase